MTIALSPFLLHRSPTDNQVKWGLVEDTFSVAMEKSNQCSTCMHSIHALPCVQKFLTNGQYRAIEVDCFWLKLITGNKTKSHILIYFLILPLVYILP